MLLEQEMASIMAFIYKESGAEAAYYWDVPQHFQVPSVYFPVPEESSGGETFLTYHVDYAWYVKLFEQTSQRAYVMGRNVLREIRSRRNLVPMVDEGGSEVPNMWVRVNDPSLKSLDNGAAQLEVTWRSRMPYCDAADFIQRSSSIHVDVFMKSGKTITDEYADALERYSVATPPGIGKVQGGSNGTES